jgi:DNA-binding CsgD family transcriptional regulator
MPRARSTHVERLTDGASLLRDARKVIESVVLALSEAVPRERSPGALVLSPSGAIIAASPIARDWLRRDEELGQWLREKPPLAGTLRLRHLSLQVAPYASRTGLRWQIVHCTPSQELPPARLAERASTPLSPREREICEWLIAGYTNAEIAAQVGVRPSTVKTMLERLYGKLDVGGRVDLTRLLSREE